jgi:hypothetical protein
MGVEAELPCKEIFCLVIGISSADLGVSTDLSAMLFYQRMRDACITSRSVLKQTGWATMWGHTLCKAQVQGWLSAIKNPF